MKAVSFSVMATMVAWLLSGCATTPDLSRPTPANASPNLPVVQHQMTVQIKTNKSVHKAHLSYWTGTRIIHVTPHDCIAITDQQMGSDQFNFGDNSNTVSIPTIIQITKKVACPAPKTQSNSAAHASSAKPH